MCMADYSDDYSIVLHDRDQKARKPHKCSECYRVIEAGEKYNVQRTVNEILKYLPTADVSTRKDEGSAEGIKPVSDAPSPANYTLPPETIISESHNIVSSEIPVLTNEEQLDYCVSDILRAFGVAEICRNGMKALIRPYMATREPVSVSRIANDVGEYDPSNESFEDYRKYVIETVLDAAQVKYVD